MKTIWKYPIDLTEVQEVLMPDGAEILTAQIQPGSGICLWALVDSENDKIPRVIEIFGTGRHIPIARRRHLGTVQLNGGDLVWHVFERV